VLRPYIFALGAKIIANAKISASRPLGRQGLGGAEYLAGEGDRKHDFD
jgi:hypothetical protein